ncbi:MAG: MMPL family transporter [Desulfobacteraceae bacterium]|nr:MMPL family transporter [Desulfobacteraceae bacterium]
MKLNQIVEKSVIQYPKIILLVFLVIAICAGSLLSGLTRDPQPYLLPPSHESRVNLEKLRENYTGSKDSVLILLEANQSIFTYETLSRIKNLTNAFENIDIVTDQDRATLLTLSQSVDENLKKKINTLATKEIDSETWMLLDEISEELSLSQDENGTLIKEIANFEAKLSPIIEVTSLSNTDNILGKNGELDVSPIYEDVPKNIKELELIKEKVLSNDLFHNILVLDDQRYTSIIVELAVGDEQSNEKYIIYKRIENILENQIKGPEKHYIAGMPVVMGAIGEVMQQDTKRLFPIVLLIVSACLFLTFRKIKGVFVPLAVVLLSLIVTLGIKVLFNISLNILTTTLPVFILSIGVADGIHIFSEYRDMIDKGHNKIDAVKLMLQHLTMPVIMTSITTAVAFYSISLTEIIQLQHFGIFIAAGTIIAMFFSLLFIPALLVLLPEKGKAKNRKPSKFEKKYTDILISFTSKVISKPRLIAAIAGTIFIIALFGASKVVVDNNNAEYFLADSPIYISSQKLNNVSAGSSVINFLINDNSNQDQPFKNPANLAAANDLVMFLKSQPKVGKILGLTELIKRINYVVNDEDEKFNIVPSSQNKDNTDSSAENMISQLLLLYENGGGDVLSDLTDSDYKALNIQAVLKTNSSHETLQLTKKARVYVKHNFPDNLSLDISGVANVAVAATDEIVSGQITSLAVSLVVVFCMLLFTFRAFSYAAIAIVPLIMTIAINFGIMGFLGISLDIGTAVISSIVIGIGVDYGIHYISRFRANRENNMDFIDALNNTISHSGKAIVSNAITVGFGFIALLFSILSPLIIMGWMITVTMVVSATATLALIPVLIIFLESPVSQGTSATQKRQITLNPQPHS